MSPRDHLYHRHPGEGRDLVGASIRDGEIPAFAGMTNGMKNRVPTRR